MGNGDESRVCGAAPPFSFWNRDPRKAKKSMGEEENKRAPKKWGIQIHVIVEEKISMTF